MVILNCEQQHIIEDLYKQTYHQLFIYARSGFRDHDLAEEAVQDTFRIACVKIDDLVACPNPDGWLMNTLKFTMRNIKKKQAHTNALFVSSRELDENIAVLSPEISPETEAACIDILGEADYQMLKQVALKELTIREAAMKHGLSEEACSKRIQRNKKKLKKHFQENSE